MTRTFSHHRMPRSSRAGSVYVLVLATATLLAVGGLSVLTLARLQIRRDAQQRDLDRATVLAESAIHAALGCINATSSWRSQITKAPNPVEIDLGVGTATWIVQESDGSALASAVPAPVRIVGIGSSGGARRVYAVTASPPPEAAYDALRCALHADGRIEVAGPVNSNGVLSSNATISNGSKLVGDIEAAVFENGGQHSGTVLAPAPYKFMPDYRSTTFTHATPISYFALPSGKLSQAVLSPSTNPYGVASLTGIYSISVPSGKSLVISDCRILATLFVDLAANAELKVDGSVCWQPYDSSLPTLVVRGASGSAVLLESDCRNTLSEASAATNFNPPLVPYAGSTDLDTSDRYPSEILGLIDLHGSATLRIGSGQRIFGCVLTRGSVKLDDAFIQSDPALLTFPPTGFTGVPDTLVLERGTWTMTSFDDIAPTK